MRKKIATTIITALTLAIMMPIASTMAKGPHGQGSIKAGQDEITFPDLATISMVQAQEAALAHVRGKTLKIELENENGFLVYGVEIVTPDKMLNEVKVDAGTGKILRIEKDNPDENRDDEDNNENDNEGDDNEND